ncbi:MAG TPA: hypothetical protein VNT03_03675 [Baekduia sp.]|nr:hypothetical protein [Baekduia sp.]
MTKNKIAGAVAALSLMAAPAVAVAHGGGDDHGRHQGAHHKHQNKKGKFREVTGKATGTIASFANGELTIALPDGKSYSALVTDHTIVKCKTAAPASTTTPSTTAPATTATPASGALPLKVKPSHHGDDDNKGDVNGNGRCGADALVAGTQVSEAKLSLKGGNATWKKVVLLK